MKQNKLPLLYALGAGLVGFALAAPALAETARVAATGDGVDLSGFAMQAISVAAVVLTAAAGVVSKFAVSFLASKTRMNDSAFEALLASRADDILNKAIGYAELWAKQQVADPNSDIRSVKIDNLFVRMAVEYAQGSMPDIIAHFGLTKERIENMIRARLNAFVLSPAVNSGSVSTTSAGPSASPPTDAPVP